MNTLPPPSPTAVRPAPFVLRQDGVVSTSGPGPSSDPRAQARAKDTTTGAKVLVVDDEPAIRQAVSLALRYEGFDVAEAANGREALAAVERQRPALVVLDIMLPDYDGFEVTRRLRDSGVNVPVVFLTAKDATEDKVQGLALGGDDYLTKPFSLEELVARVQAVLRRTGMQQRSSRLVFHDLEMDEDTHEVWRAGAPVNLTATEFRLLRLFLLNPRRVLSKMQILEHVWDYDFGGDGNIVETYVSYLRKKVDTVDPPLLHTVRGAGYVLRLPS
jgi:two-component system, OmpR family, response regulator